MPNSTVQPEIAKKANYNRFPSIRISEDTNQVIRGWDSISAFLLDEVDASNGRLIIETYQGVDPDPLLDSILKLDPGCTFISMEQAFKTPDDILAMTKTDMGDHPVFGRMTALLLTDFFVASKLDELRDQINTATGIVVVAGPGASLLVDEYDLLIYLDMARWEIQQRMRRGEVSNLGLENNSEKVSLRYKRSYFIDWRALDLHKRQLFSAINYFIDTHTDEPKLVPGDIIRDGLRKTASQPFRVVPFFDPGIWGGQWMKEVFNLDEDEINYAWCFDCVPEENSLLFEVGNEILEFPSINLVFEEPEALLGPDVYGRFGAEFPIRFDFLDTMEGGNLSLQVHPLKEYAKEHFGLDYTQDESYYMLDAGADAMVYLGFRDGIDRAQMLEDLETSQKNGLDFNAGKYVEVWPVKKHDHVLIPAGTIHCSGRNSMVLEISATPYIFTFKMWDWGRVDLDGLPRPISLEHAKNTLQWDRTTEWTRKELINRIEPLKSGDGWREESTGLHESEFIETRRHWFSEQVEHHTEDTVNVLNLVEGREIIVESPDGAFEPKIMHYAETFIVPAAVGPYTIRPHGESVGKECATLKAYVRKEQL